MSDIEAIGDLRGAKVLVNKADNTIIIASDDFPPIKFSVDHPYIKGTKLEQIARKALSGPAAPYDPDGDVPSELQEEAELLTNWNKNYSERN